MKNNAAMEDHWSNNPRFKEAERLADALEQQFPLGTAQGYLDGEAAAELRRLVSINNDLMDEVARLQKREWVGLTEEEIKQAGVAVPFDGQPDWSLRYARAIEAKLKENT